MRSILLLLVLLLPLAASEPVLGETREALSFEAVFDLEWGSDPHPGPDGERVAFVRNRMDRHSDRVRSRLWVVDVDGSNLEPLTPRERNASSPRWSPDGGRLAYVADGQIFVHWLQSGRDGQISEFTHAPSDLSWSPDGRWLAFVMFTPSSQEPPVTLPGRPEGAEWAEAPVYIDRLYYRADGAGFLSQGYRHVYVIPAEGGSAMRLTDGDFHHGDLSWHPDGSALYLTANRSGNAEREPLKRDIYRLDVEDRDLQRVTTEPGPYSSPTVSPNGSRLAWLGFEDRRLSHQANRLFVRPLDGGPARNLTEDLDRSVDAFQWLDDDTLAITYDHHGRKLLARQALAGAREVLTDDLGGIAYGRPYTSGTFRAAAGNLAYTRARPDRPAEIALIGPSGARDLTDLNRDFSARYRLGEVEEFWYASSVDERKLQGWIIYPPDFDSAAAYPMILEIHGGPFATYGPSFAMELQLMAARGYVVLYTNPRGSTSYGEDFANLIHHNYPSHDFDDLMDGVDKLLERGVVDPDRLYVTGGSGGGVLTAWIVGHTDRFAAAVSAKPVINWYSFVLNADAYSFFSQYWFPGPPWDHAEHYLKYSPISYVGNVSTPTMLLTGEADYRTPMSETEQYYQALQLRGVDTAMVRIPEATHAIYRRPSNLMAKVAYILHWFERHGGVGD